MQLRSHPLAPMGAGACALLQELSEEQSFAISYLDIGEYPLLSGHPTKTHGCPCPGSGRGGGVVGGLGGWGGGLG